MLPRTDFHDLFLTAIYHALILATGYAVLCAVLRSQSRHWVELIGLSFAAGAGVIPLSLFVISVIGLKPSRVVLGAIGLVVLLSLLRTWKKRLCCLPTVPARPHKLDILTPLGFLAAGLLAIASCNVAARAAWPGLNDMDAFANWMFKAKCVMLVPLRPVPAVFTDPSVSYSHQDYPLSLPLLVAGLYAAIGHLNEMAAKILLLPTYLSLMAIVYGAVRRNHRRATALAVTAIFAAAPTLTKNAGLLIAETPLILSFAATLSMLLRWIESGERPDLILTGLFAAIAAFSKNEGLALLLVVGTTSLIIAILRSSRGAMKDWFIAATLSAVVIAPWLLYRTHLPKTHEDYGAKLTQASTIVSNLHRLTEVLPEFLRRLFDAPRAGLVWYVLIITAVTGYRAFQSTGVRALWCILLIQLSLYVATFVVTPWNVQELLGIITPKLLTQASPCAALLIGLHLRSMRWPGRQGDKEEERS